MNWISRIPYHIDDESYRQSATTNLRRNNMYNKDLKSELSTITMGKYGLK